ncbi:MAG: hypothetical protein ACTTJ1_01820 [Treponema sp.]
MVKLYIVSGIPNRWGNTYNLISEDGEFLACHFCSSKYWAIKYLVRWNKDRILELNKRFGKDNWDVFYLGDDDMTFQELSNRSYNFYTAKKRKIDIKT